MNSRQLKENRLKAERHYNVMKRNYQSEIDESIRSTKTFSGIVTADCEIVVFSVEVIDCDTVTAAFEYPGSCVLNFSSYKNPGGGFLKGMMAQEEAICHESSLYNILETQKDFYAWNWKNLNHGLYEDRALWTPGVVLSRNGIAGGCDVITCAAPNWTAAKKNGISKEENLVVLRQRIRNIIYIAALHNEIRLILGAYGCGVFGQDAGEVARIFKEELMATSVIPQVIFAIPKGNGNYERFEDVFY